MFRYISKNGRDITRADLKEFFQETGIAVDNATCDKIIASKPFEKKEERKRAPAQNSQVSNQEGPSIPANSANPVQRPSGIGRPVPVPSSAPASAIRPVSGGGQKPREERKQPVPA